MMSRQRSLATVSARRAPAKGKRLLRLAWISVALMPVAFVAAMLIGEGLISLQGYKSGADQFPTTRRDPARRHSGRPGPAPPPSRRSVVVRTAPRANKPRNADWLGQRQLGRFPR